MNFKINLNYLVFLFLLIHDTLYKLTVYLVPFRKVPFLCFYLKPFLANVFA